MEVGNNTARVYSTIWIYSTPTHPPGAPRPTDKPNRKQKLTHTHKCVLFVTELNL